MTNKASATTIMIISFAFICLLIAYVSVKPEIKVDTVYVYQDTLYDTTYVPVNVYENATVNFIVDSEIKGPLNITTGELGIPGTYLTTVSYCDFRMESIGYPDRDSKYRGKDSTDYPVSILNFKQVVDSIKEKSGD